MLAGLRKFLWFSVQSRTGVLFPPRRLTVGVGCGGFVRNTSVPFRRMTVSRPSGDGSTKDSFHSLRVNSRTGPRVIAASILLTFWLPALAVLLREDRWMPAVFFAAVPMLFTTS